MGRHRNYASQGEITVGYRGTKPRVDRAGKSEATVRRERGAEAAKRSRARARNGGDFGYGALVGLRNLLRTPGASHAQIAAEVKALVDTFQPFDGALPSEHQALFDDLKNESENGAPPPPPADDMPSPLEDIMPSPMPTNPPSPMPTSLPTSLPSPAPPMADESADASSDLMGYVGNATGASGSIDASQLRATMPMGDTLLVPTRTEKTISNKLSNTETLVRNLDRFSPEPLLPAIPTAPLSAAIPSSVGGQCLADDDPLSW